ncbi:transporter [Piscinibacter sp.]|uniref:transporter n=1 Tax=Piscinibacter sp. TaxID=1903157 RepID=UPI00355A705E
MSAYYPTHSTVANIAAVLALTLASSVASAQDSAPAPAASASAPATTDAARAALAKKEGDVDQAKLLKETLSAADKQYSLLKTGKQAVTYDLTYSYIGQQLIQANFTDDKLTLFDIQNTRSHTVTNTVSVDHGVMDNLTASVTLPFVSKYSQSETFSGLSNAFGDISLGARFQPFALSRDLPALTATGTLRLPTGRSPFKTIDGQGLGTGAGYTSVTLGANASKVIDPVALFGSLNATLAVPAKHLSQTRNGRTLTEVRPGAGIGFGVGFAYALSYNISTTLSFQESISARTKLTLVDSNGVASESKTSMQSSAMLNMGLGVRVSPLTTVNFTVGVGLTTDSPDFTFGMNMPLHF